MSIEIADHCRQLEEVGNIHVILAFEHILLRPWPTSATVLCQLPQGQGRRK